jgi:hypothetical protein
VLPSKANDAGNILPVKINVDDDHDG